VVTSERPSFQSPTPNLFLPSVVVVVVVGNRKGIIARGQLWNVWVQGRGEGVDYSHTDPTVRLNVTHV